jgi:hypothetical protein
MVLAYCCVCGRKLSNNKHIEEGIGPVCKIKRNKEEEKYQKLDWWFK